MLRQFDISVSYLFVLHADLTKHTAICFFIVAQITQKVEVVFSLVTWFRCEIHKIESSFEKSVSLEANSRRRRTDLVAVDLKLLGI